MPDIKDLLGKKEEEGVSNPLEATPDGEGDEGNPLEKMDEISKSKPDNKKAKAETLDPETVEQMLLTGENTEGMFTPDEKKEKEGEAKIHEDVDKEAKVSVGKAAEPKGKYQKMFTKNLLEKPDEYKIMTPKGEMTVAEAISKGYNPITKRFDRAHDQAELKKKKLSALNDADREALEKFTSPEAAQVAPADAEKYGLAPGSRMIKQEAPMGGAPAMPAPAAPNNVAAMLGGAPEAAAPAMPQGSSPVGGQIPGGSETQAAGGLDLSALLGGGK